MAWLYAGETERLPPTAREEIERCELAISSAVLPELEYLKETKRLTDEPRVIQERLGRTIGLRERDASLADVISEAMLQEWTRDPFDRMIVAQAALDHVRLLTKDRTILKNYGNAFWSKIPSG